MAGRGALRHRLYLSDSLFFRGWRRPGGAAHGGLGVPKGVAGRGSARGRLRWGRLLQGSVCAPLRRPGRSSVGSQHAAGPEELLHQAALALPEGGVLGLGPGGLPEGGFVAPARLWPGSPVCAMVAWAVAAARGETVVQVLRGLREGVQLPLPAGWLGAAWGPTIAIAIAI